MGLNNNYGFKTLDEDGTSLNGKWPIFGFDIENVERAFRTTRITDTSVNNVTSIPSTLTPVTDGELTYTYYQYYTDGNGSKNSHGVVKKLVAQYEHGYDYIPSGYFTITGNMNMSATVRVDQTGSGTYYVQNYYGDFNRQGDVNINYNKLTSVPIYPYMDGFYLYGLGPMSAPPGVSGQGAVGQYMMQAKIGITNTNDIIVPSGQNGYILGNGYTVSDIYDIPAAYIDVEIDSKYVKIYKYYAWYDSYVRVNRYFTYPGSEDMFWDISNRIRMVAQTTGSTFDVNVYLTPHKLEDMVLNG